MNLTRGEARFREARVVRVDAPPQGAQYVFDLDQIRKQEVRGPIGHRWTLLATYLLLSAVCFLGWLMLSERDSNRR
jgi:hypothetical protein